VLEKAQIAPTWVKEQMLLILQNKLAIRLFTNAKMPSLPTQFGNPNF
jgi:hypothetical protein